MEIYQRCSKKASDFEIISDHLAYFWRKQSYFDFQWCSQLVSFEESRQMVCKGRLYRHNLTDHLCFCFSGDFVSVLVCFVLSFEKTCVQTNSPSMLLHLTVTEHNISIALLDYKYRDFSRDMCTLSRSFETASFIYRF